MSFCMQKGPKGKDRVIFVTKKDHDPPSVESTVPPDQGGYEEYKDTLGRTLPDGRVNWDCACLGGIPYGPCGTKFREFKNCTEQYGNFSAACVPPVLQLRDCFKKYPSLFKSFLDDDDDIDVESKTNSENGNK